MASIDGRPFTSALKAAICFMAFACSFPVFAADGANAVKTTEGPATVSVGDELARLTKDAYARSAGAGKRAALAELASLRELAGDLEGAATAWTDAAFAAAEGRDDRSLLEAARCLIALGEFDRAFADLRTVLITGREPDTLSRARYLGAQIAAFRGDADAKETLSVFIDDPEYADRRPATLYLLWRISSEESFRTRLLADHGTSPEASLATAAESISVARTPLWLFFPAGGEVLPAGEPGGGDAGAASVLTVATSAEPVVDATQVGAKVPESTDKSERVVLQIGLFRGEENAKVLMKRLEAAGFKAEIVRRVVEKDEYLAVTVSGGDNPNEAIIRLKDAGFESFPLY